MKIKEEGFYHIFNRGNNKQQIFFNKNDYLFFLELTKKYIFPRSEIIAWCLMPNHFHFVLSTNEVSLNEVKWGGNIMPNISNGFQLLLNSYAKAINKRENRTGSLFQQKTKALFLENEIDIWNVFWYTHFNPVKAKLVETMKDWEFSSFLDYANMRYGKLCNMTLAKDVLNLHNIDFLNFAPVDLTEDKLKRILK